MNSPPKRRFLRLVIIEQNQLGMKAADTLIIIKNAALAIDITTTEIVIVNVIDMIIENDLLVMAVHRLLPLRLAESLVRKKTLIHP